MRILSLSVAAGWAVCRAKDTAQSRCRLKIFPSPTLRSRRLARFRRGLSSCRFESSAHRRDLRSRQANGQQFLVLELVDGESGSTHLCRRIPSMRRSASQADCGGANAHERGSFTGSRSPQTSLFTTGSNVKVLDWTRKVTEPVPKTSKGATTSAAQNVERIVLQQFT
ncbi:MAG: hypothetical protein Udaeo2_22870 [Candidatus Udaeobacter sp.]|nr:MAG: hypothetical protein Udaeo2_22870 [Candidatus Udaeobacter sp.]